MPATRGASTLPVWNMAKSAVGALLLVYEVLSSSPFAPKSVAMLSSHLVP